MSYLIQQKQFSLLKVMPRQWYENTCNRSDASGEKLITNARSTWRKGQKQKCQQHRPIPAQLVPAQAALPIPHS